MLRRKAARHPEEEGAEPPHEGRCDQGFSLPGADRPHLRALERLLHSSGEGGGHREAHDRHSHVGVVQRRAHRPAD